MDQRTWRQVQDVLDGRSGIANVPHVRKHPDFPLPGCVRCTLCRRLVTASKSTGKLGGKFPYYFCTTKGHLSEPAEVVESAFGEMLLRMRPNRGHLDLICTVFSRVWNEKQGSRQIDEEK